MKLIICQCCPCKTESQFYVKSIKKYVCRQVKVRKYPDEDSIQLILSDEVIRILTIIDQCRKEFEVSSCNPPSKRAKESLVITLKQETDVISSALSDANTNSEHYKFPLLLKKAEWLKEMMLDHETYLEFLKTKNWQEGMDVIENKREKSAALVELETINRCNLLLKNTTSKLKQQREDLKEELNLTNEALDEANQALDEANQALDEANQEIKNLWNKKNKYKKNKNDLIGQNNQLHLKYDELMKSHQQMEEKIEGIEKRLNQKINKVRELKQKVKNLLIELEESKKENERLQDKVSQRDHELEEEQKENTCMKREIEHKVKETKKLMKIHQSEKEEFEQKLNEKTVKIKRKK